MPSISVGFFIFLHPKETIFCGFLSFGISVLSILLSNQGYQWLSFTALFLWPSWLIGAWIAILYRDQKIKSRNQAFLPTFLPD